MAFQTNAIKNYILNTGSYAAACAYVALASTTPGGSAGTEIVGGSYARIASAWTTATVGVMSTGALPFNVAAGVTVAGANLMSASTGGTYYDGVGMTSQTFVSAGTDTVTLTQTLT